MADQNVIYSCSVCSGTTIHTRYVVGENIPNIKRYFCYSPCGRYTPFYKEGYEPPKKRNSNRKQYR